MLPWSTIDTVLLDMDGTLLDLHFDNYFWQDYIVQRYADIHGLSLDEAGRRVLPRIRELAGTLNWYCLDFWSRELELDVVRLKREIDHLIAIHPYAEDFLHRMQGRKSLILVTNAHRGSLDLKLERTGIERYFDAVVSSHDYRRAKEEPAFWQTLRDRLDFDPARTLLVEDNVRILDTARRFGIAHLLAITRPDSRAAPKSVDGYPAIEHFGELLADMEF